MSALDLITEDARRMGPGGRPGRVARLLVVAALVALALSVAWALEPLALAVPGVPVAAPLAVLLLAAAAWTALAPPGAATWRAVWICATVTLALSCVREGFPDGAPVTDPDAFLLAAGQCFVCGLGVSLVAGGLLTLAAFRWRPLPSTRWSWALGAVSGLFGVTMLDIHCPSTDWRHILLGHWGQGLLLALWTVALQRWLLARRLAKALGPRAGRLKRLWLLGRG